jgi:hypothetical protein
MHAACGVRMVRNNCGVEPNGLRSGMVALFHDAWPGYFS